MITSRKVILLFSLIFIFLWPFYINKFAIDQKNRYRVLANGWISATAYVHLDDQINITQKIRYTIEEDLLHGRFRPLFFVYTTIPYAVSPIIHERITEEGRPYRRLINGDLRIFSFILLGTVGLSFVLMSIIIYNYTKELYFSFIPVLFIPLSQTLTFNLLAGVIDSQEILLILIISLWIVFIFWAIQLKSKAFKYISFYFSVLFLLTGFLVKETFLVVGFTIFITAFLFSLLKKKSNDKIEFNLNQYFFIFSTFISFVCSIILISIVFKYKREYAAGYGSETYEDIKESIKLLWNWMSLYSLNNIHGYIPVILAFIILFKNISGTINKIQSIYHIILLFILLSISYGFLFILVPWKPLGEKYVIPSVFFFSFAVALSLALIAAWAKERYKKKGTLIYLVIPIYIIVYLNFSWKSEEQKNYLVELGGYGVDIIDELADDIQREYYSSEKKSKSIYIDYGDNVSTGITTPFGRIQLMRILNLEKGVNFIDEHGKPIKNYRMPSFELSSFKENNFDRNLFLSEKEKDINLIKFDILYRRCSEDHCDLSVLNFNNNCYKQQGGYIHYKSKSGFFPDFYLYKYKPSECQNINGGPFSVENI